MNHERDVAFQPIAQLSPRICAGEVSPVFLTELSLHRIQALNPTLNAFITVTRDLAMAQARAAAANRRRSLARTVARHTGGRERLLRHGRHPDDGGIPAV